MTHHQTEELFEAMKKCISLLESTYIGKENADEYFAVQELKDTISSSLKRARSEVVREAARIVRGHTVKDWSGEAEVYEELEKIAKKIELLTTSQEGKEE